MHLWLLSIIFISLPAAHKKPERYHIISKGKRFLSLTGQAATIEASSTFPAASSPFQCPSSEGSPPMLLNASQRLPVSLQTGCSRCLTQRSTHSSQQQQHQKGPHLSPPATGSHQGEGAFISPVGVWGNPVIWLEGAWGGRIGLTHGPQAPATPPPRCPLTCHFGPLPAITRRPQSHQRKRGLQ